MAADDAAVVVTLRANLKDYEAALKSAVRATERAAKSAEDAISSVGKKAATAPVSQVFQKSSQQIANDARVLQYQLNDIFSGVASGQGIRAVQMQLGQIAQQLGGQGIGAAARTMGSALVGMINPINLAVVAFGALATVAASYFSDSEEGSEKSEKAIKAQRDLIRDVAKQWGDALPALKAYNDELERQEDLQQQIKGLQAAAGGLTGEIQKQLEVIDVGRLEDAFSAFERFPKYADDVAAWNRKWEEFQRNLEDGTATQKQYNEFQALTNKLLNELPMSGIDALQARWLKAQELITGYLDQLVEVIAKEKELIDVSVQSAAAINRMVTLPGIGAPATSGAGVFNPSQTQMENAKKAREEAERASKEAARELERATEQNKREAERAAEEAAEQLNKAIANQTKVAVDAVTGMLGKSETANAAEINSFLKRGGVDLDAATTAWCAAFVNSALAQVGIKGTGSQVATSFMNWGQAVKPQDIQRGDVLVDPNGRKAGQAGGHVGFATGNVRALGDAIVEVEMISGNASDKVTQEWVAASEVIARRSTDAFQLSGEALQHLSDEAAATAAASKKAFEDQARMAQQMNQAMAGIIGSGLSSFIQDLIAGEDAGDAFAKMLQRMAAQMADLVVQMLIIRPLMNAMGGGLGGGMGGGLFEGGGTVGLSGRKDGRKFSPATWAGAPRFASGGMVGLRPGEVPIIAHRGEIIVPNARRLASSGQGGGVQNTYSMDNAKIAIDMSAAGVVAADSDSAKQFGTNVQKLVQQEMVRQSRPGGLLRRVPG